MSNSRIAKWMWIDYEGEEFGINHDDKWRNKVPRSGDEWIPLLTGQVQ